MASSKMGKSRGCLGFSFSVSRVGDDLGFAPGAIFQARRTGFFRAFFKKVQIFAFLQNLGWKMAFSRPFGLGEVIFQAGESAEKLI